MQKAFAPGAEDGVPSEEVLRTLRIPFVRRVFLTHRGQSRDAFILDVGLAGVFVEHDGTLTVGEGVVISFPLPENEIPVVARCRVAWCHRPEAPLLSKNLPPGIGLEFVELSDRDRERIRDLVVSHCRRPGRARHFLRHWPRSEGAGDDP